jgi:hypothetical protein
LGQRKGVNPDGYTDRQGLRDHRRE